jgi:hypothetical protein
MTRQSQELRVSFREQGRLEGRDERRVDFRRAMGHTCSRDFFPDTCGQCEVSRR